ncbi:MAG: hypothetical protein IJ604_14595 [Prevotella sp.]|nr:hypothetical protein [Prevotella sp.]MBR1464589.1 hypothetical protein [Prevotella sp.]
MKRKDYRKPTLRIIESQQQEPLLEESYGSEASLQNYEWHETAEESKSSIWTKDELFNH